LVLELRKALTMMLMSSISDVDWCCCKWFENRSRFRSLRSIWRSGLGAHHGPQLVAAPLHCSEATACHCTKLWLWAIENLPCIAMGHWQIYADYRLDQTKLHDWLKKTFGQQEFYLKVRLDSSQLRSTSKLLCSMSALTLNSTSQENWLMYA